MIGQNEKKQKKHAQYYLNYQVQFCLGFYMHLTKILHLETLFYYLFLQAARFQNVFF